jgi:cobalt/nickel transport system permease protein
VLAFIALVATQPIATVGQALGSLKVPNKLVQLLLLTYRYVFVIELEYRRLSRAATMRGFLPGTNLHTYKTYAYMVGILFVRAGLRAQRVHQAMRCRGFDGRFHTLHQFHYARKEHLWSLFFVSAILTIGGLEWLIG